MRKGQKQEKKRISIRFICLAFLILCFQLFLNGCITTYDDEYFDESVSLASTEGIPDLNKAYRNTYYNCFFDISVSGGSEYTRYPVDFYLDGKCESTIESGSSDKLSYNLKFGTHRIKFEKRDDRAVFGDTLINISAEGQRMKIKVLPYGRYIDIEVVSDQ